MFISKLELYNFRNYEKFGINFDCDKSLIVGKNACGKTNLLESVKYLTDLTSVKAKQDCEMIKQGCDFARIKGEFSRDGGNFSAEVVINPPKRKILKINEVKQAKTADYLTGMYSVSFTTPDLLLLRGSPEDRRNWLNSAIGGIYPAYRDRLAKYNRVRLQKSNCLKDFPPNRQMLDVWNEQLAVCGTNVIRLRLLYLKEAEKFSALMHSKISPSEKLTLRYETTPGILTSDDISPETILKNFRETLHKHKEEEIARGRCIIGPHTDDISFFVNGSDAKKFASQGQQRTVVLALKLAETEIISAKSGYNAIILLDDVLAELDNVRQTFLLNCIEEKHQTIITSVDTLHFDKRYLDNVKIYNLPELLG